MAEQRCPLCGKPNPDVQETCRFCGARLKPLIAASFPGEEKLSPPSRQEGPAVRGSGDDSIPAWLQSLRDGSSSPSVEREEAQKPHFGTDPGITSREKKEAVSKPASQPGVPDWLAGLRNMVAPVGSEAPREEDAIQMTPETTGEPEALPGNISSSGENERTSPDWLSRLEDKSRQVPPQAAIPGGSIPEWINALRPEETPTLEPAGEEENLPDWLSQLPSIEPLKPDHDLVGEAGGITENRGDQPATEQEFIDWFAQLQTASQPQQAESKDVETWQAGLPVQAPAALPAISQQEIRTEALINPEIKPSVNDLGIPDWLSTLPSDQKSDEEEGEQALPGAMGKVELPSWVKALQPVETIISGTVSKLDEAASKVETIGPLAGLAGVLPLSLGEVSKHKPPVARSRLQITSNQQKYAAALEKMVQEEGQGKLRKIPGTNPSRMLRIILSVILLGTVLLPLLAGFTLVPDLSLFPSEWDKTNQIVQDIPAGSPLLVVFDYDTALAGELEAAAAPLIDHLLARAVHLVFLSTSPVGPALAGQFMANQQPDLLKDSKVYTNLGYLAGGPAGMQLFSSDPRQTMPLDAEGRPAWEAPGLSGIRYLSDFGAVLLLVDNADTGRFWIEQTRAYLETTPLLVVISAQAEPMIRPYFDSGQVQGLVTGLMGGKTFEQTYDTPGTARRYWDAFGFGMLMVVTLIAVGSVWSALKTWNNRKKTESSNL